MPYKLAWYNQTTRIISGEISEELTLTEIENFSTDMIAFLETGISPVHFILDASKLVKFPTNISVLRQAVTFLGRRQLGWVVIIGGSSLMLTFAQLLMQITPTRYRSVRTRQEALEFLASVDESLAQPE
jgi:hypothetical protein